RHTPRTGCSARPLERSNEMNRLRRTLTGVALVAVAMAGCGNDDGSAPSAARGASFAGPVAGTDALVGVVVNPGDRRVMA
ncbi:MAG: hypothetical protein ABR540_17905, partial [Acidimicrobiales bacterium]